LFSWTPPNQILQCVEHLPAGNTISTLSKRCKKTEQWILHPQVQEYAVVIATKCKDPHGWTNCVDGFNLVYQISEYDLILRLSDQMLDWHILCEKMLHQVELIADHLQIIMWIWIPTGLYIKLQCVNQDVQEEDR
jgi:hypothetical protein